MKILILGGIFLFGIRINGYSQNVKEDPELDKKVKAFLDSHDYSWRDMNIPASDGQLLFNLIVDNGYTHAVEIGTSTGHSGVWIAWALSKTGGKLITIEIDKDRYLQARANFKKAGVSKYIDVRLADAHELVPQLEGEYDFVFSDADKYWYKNYFIAMNPKLEEGGCFVAHNTAMRVNGIRDFLEYIESHPDYTTTYDEDSRSGLSISYKRASK